MKEINSLQSEELRKLAQFLSEKRIPITYFGKAWGNAKGNWVYFNTYLDLDELRQQFAFGEHIKEHQNLDPRSGTESGFIDENTGEGIMGRLRQ